jgi:hypothetical protein
MMRRLLITITLATFTLSVGVASAQAPTWNSGYMGWWPSGFGYPPATAPANDYRCSVTAYGPTFKTSSTGWNQFFGGGTSCAAGVGQKTLTIYDQVLGQDGHTWYTISDSKFTAGPMNGNPLRMLRSRAAFLGHTYRTMAFAKLVVPNGHAGCSLNDTCSQEITVTAISRPLAP